MRPGAAESGSSERQIQPRDERSSAEGCRRSPHCGNRAILSGRPIFAINFTTMRSTGHQFNRNGTLAILLAIACLSGVSHAAHAQHIGQEQQKAFENREDSLKGFAFDIVNADTATKRFRADSQFIRSLVGRPPAGRLSEQPFRCELRPLAQRRQLCPHHILRDPPHPRPSQTRVAMSHTQTPITARMTSARSGLVMRGARVAAGRRFFPVIMGRTRSCRFTIA